MEWRKNTETKTYKIKQSKIPVKSSINLANYDQKRMNKGLALAGILIIILLSGIFCKFAVVDRLYALYKIQAKESSLQAEIAEQHALLKKYDEIENQYAHYTYSDMTDEELTTVDQEDIINLLDKYVLNKTKVSNFSVSENVIVLPITDLNLKSINMIVGDLQSDDRVAYCTVNTAQTSEEDLNTDVTAQVTIYLNPKYSEIVNTGEGDSE